MPDIFDVMVIPFREASGFAAEYEFRVRLLADKTTGLRSASLANMSVLEQKVLEYFASHLQPGDHARLEATRRLRNKLLHGEFHNARECLDVLGHPKPAATVKVARIPMDGSLTVESFEAALRDSAPFAVDTTPSSGNIFAWFFQLSTDGSLRHAADVFRSANAILIRLAAIEED